MFTKFVEHSLIGVIKGFNVYTQFPTSSRPFTLGLYRPVSGKNCTYTLLKRWTPTITEANKVTEVKIISNIIT